MRRHDADHYLNSPSFLRAERSRRRWRKLYLTVEEIEPRSKRAMPQEDALRFQKAILGQLATCGRRAFKSPVVVKVRLETSEANPAQPYNIVKNLLDLLARPVPGLSTSRRALVYADDEQIDVLSVICHHGRPNPSIYIEVSPLRDLLDPLAMAWLSRDTYAHDDDALWERSYDLDRAREFLTDLRSGESAWRAQVGNDEYESLTRFALQRVQESFFGRRGLTVANLAMMFNLVGRWSNFDTSEIWDKDFASSLFGIRLTELPQCSGQSAAWKNEVDARLEEFRQRYSRLLDPLLIPVACEVVVRPPPPSRQNNVHDLDNVMRTYLLPRVLQTFEPPSHYAFTLRDPHHELPPRSTRIGVTRYEAWRLPPAPEGSNGFVSMAVVTDFAGYDCGVSRAEKTIDKWLDALD